MSAARSLDTVRRAGCMHSFKGSSLLELPKNLRWLPKRVDAGPDLDIWVIVALPSNFRALATSFVVLCTAHSQTSPRLHLPSKASSRTGIFLNCFRTDSSSATVTPLSLRNLLRMEAAIRSQRSRCQSFGCTHETGQRAVRPSNHASFYLPSSCQSAQSKTQRVLEVDHSRQSDLPSERGLFRSGRRRLSLSKAVLASTTPSRARARLRHVKVNMSMKSKSPSEAGSRRVAQSVGGASSPSWPFYLDCPDEPAP